MWLNFCGSIFGDIRCEVRMSGFCIFKMIIVV